MKIIKIRIADMRSPWRYFFRVTLSIMLFVFWPIYVGVLVGSTAMQWAGFMFGIAMLAALGYGAAQKRERVATSFDEARQMLDDMERADG